MKRYVRFIVLLFIFMFMISGVYAGYDDGTKGENKEAGKGCSGEDSCWNESSYYGLRVSVYIFDKNKPANRPTQKIGKTVDFIGSRKGSEHKGSGQPTRYNVLDNGSVSFTSKKGNEASSSSWLINMYNNASKLPDSVKKHVLGSCYGKDDATAEQLWDCVRPFFSEMGAEAEASEVLKNLSSGKGTKDIFIVYEPMTSVYVRATGLNYFVTGSEIAYLHKTYKLVHISSLVSRSCYVAGTAYQTKNIAGFKGISRPSSITGYMHNQDSYGISVGVAKLSDFFKDIPVPEEPVEEVVCKFDLIEKIINNCKNGTEGYVKDIDDWSCIFASRNSSNKTIQDHFYMDFTNRYCSIFCREEVYYYFPDSSLTVRAGNHFSVGNTGAYNTLLPVNMTGRSECRVNYGSEGGTLGRINYEQFKKDWANVNKRIPAAWDAMNIELAKSESIKDAVKSSEKDCANYCDANVHGLECCKEAARYWDDCCSGSPCASRNEDGTCNSTCEGGYCGSWYCVTADTPYNHGYWYTPQAKTYKGQNYQANRWCSNCGNSFTSEVCSSNTNLSSKVSSYNALINEKNNYLYQLMQCNNFQRTYRDFAPEIEFSYDDAALLKKSGSYNSSMPSYSYSGFLDHLLEIRAQTNYFKGNSNSAIHVWNTSSYKNATSELIYEAYTYTKNNDAMSDCYGSTSGRHCGNSYPLLDNSKDNASITYGSRATIKSYKCDTYRSACTATVDVTYPTNDWLRMFTTKEYDYNLPSNVYNYVKKDDGTSYSGISDRLGRNYYTIGYGNLPIHYSRVTSSDYPFYLDFSKVLFGENQRFYKFMKEKDGSQGKVGITYGQETSVSIYEQLWNNVTLNSMIHTCVQMGRHLHHDFVDEIKRRGISPRDFVNTPCAKQFSCRYDSYWDLIDCPGDTKGTRSDDYKKLRECIQKQVVDRNGHVNTNFVTTNYTYECTYTVKNEIVCPPDSNCSYIGLSAIYRTIDLNNPFPNRRPGPNWDEYSKDVYITNNRGVNTKKIYTEKGPLYKITLTPKLISNIKKYNDNHDMSDYSMNCNSVGRECKSDFIRTTYAKEFTGCGISGKGIGSCNINEAW